MIDTHAHLYLDDFTPDLPDVLSAALSAGVEQIWLPAIDAPSLCAMEPLRSSPMFRFFAGLHPCDVKEDYLEQLAKIQTALELHFFSGIGEIGLDLYWDKTFFAQQQDALVTQLDWALQRHQPALIHVRDAFDEIMPLIRPYYGKGLKAIFHSFAGTLSQALELTSEGFLLGINGTITFKNSAQAQFLSQIPLSSLVTETDSPFLTPVPFRGKRNEPKHIPLVVSKLAELYNLPPSEIDTITTNTALNLLA